MLIIIFVLITILYVSQISEYKVTSLAANWNKVTSLAANWKIYQCSDRIDNDKDGYCDYSTTGARCTDGSKLGDKDCASKTDNKEASDCVVSTEICDLKDNNCNGLIDENSVCVIIPPNSTNVTIPPNSTIPTNSTNSTVPLLGICYDSDGGINYGTKGSVTDKNGVTSPDSCNTNGIRSPSGPGLYELYCSSSGYAVTSAYTCPNGCADGACTGDTCVRKTCSEIGKSCGSWSDGCAGTITCGTCASGTTCNSNGVCEVSTGLCYDSDGGINYGTKGSVTDIDGVTTFDSCHTNGIRSPSGPGLYEMYCNPINNQYGVTSATTCANGCVDGACTA